MQLGTLEHVNVRTDKLEALVTWYRDILGMHSGDRPNFPFPGAWMYVGDKPYVHLIGVAEEPPAPGGDDLKLEHFAFSATGLTELINRLKGVDQSYDLRDIQGFGITQVNVFDPDGNHIHVDFPTTERAALGE